MERQKPESTWEREDTFDNTESVENYWNEITGDRSYSAFERSTIAVSKRELEHDPSYYPTEETITTNCKPFTEKITKNNESDEDKQGQTLEESSSRV